MIDPKAWYSMQKSFRLVKDDIGVKDFSTFSAMCQRGMIKSNKLGTQKTGTRYKIKGEWLIQFLVKWEAGDFN